MDLSPVPREKKLFGLSEKEHDLFLTFPWSIVHFLSGAAIKSLGWNFWTNFLLHGAYELKDQSKRAEVYNSMWNSVGDQFCSMAGFVLTNNSRWVPIFLFSFIFAVAFRGPDRLGPNS